VITGFNTDIEHQGTVYHVQTEDKGLDTPFILSLVYVGGAILASKRAPYNDLVTAGFDPTLLTERLQRQHKLICAAISAGRIEDLKRMSQRDPTAQASRTEAQEVSEPEVRPDIEAVAPDKSRAEKPRAAPSAAKSVAGKKASTRETPVEASSNGHDKIANAEIIPAEIDDELHLSLLEEKDFRAGEIITLRVMVMRGAFGERAVVRDAVVIVKVLGTEFRPLILTSKTDADGVAVIHVWLPRFTSGRAAILVRASSDGCSAELRRVIHHT
jgi:hypothetical protein